jgi:hypothetical protein
MNIYLLEQDEATDYDTFDSMVVIAKDEAAARLIHPEEEWSKTREACWNQNPTYTSWATDPSRVEVTLIGTADPNADEGIVLSSFNAG